MARLAQMLALDGCDVRTWCLEGARDEGRPSEAAEAARVVLPVPLEKDGCLNGTSLPLEALWPRLRKGARVYAGAVSAAARAGAEAHGIVLTDYLADEALAVRNAVPTAEGAIAEAMARMKTTLCGAPCLVVGFGRIGKLLARRLAGLGALVSVSARKAGDLAWIEALGYTPLHTEKLEDMRFRAVFNTVPHMVLDAALVGELPEDCVLVELASQPGIDAEAAKERGLSYVRAGGLPGRFAPETAALAIKKTLYRIWEEEA